METLEIVRDAYNAVCAELEKSQKKYSKLESLLRDILEVLPAEFVADTLDEKILDATAIKRLKKYISLALIAQWEIAHENKP